MNHEMVTHIKATKQPIQMNTNAGYKVLELKGQVLGFGKVYYNPDMMTNIFGFAKLAQKYHIVYDSDIEDAFHVYTDNKIIRFTRTGEGLYVYKPSSEFLEAVAEEKGMEPQAMNKTEKISCLVSTIKENKLGYTSQVSI